MAKSGPALSVSDKTSALATAAATSLAAAGPGLTFNRKGELVLRSVDFPPAAEVVRVLESIVAKG